MEMARVAEKEQSIYFLFLYFAIITKPFDKKISLCYNNYIIRERLTGNAEKGNQSIDASGKGP